VDAALWTARVELDRAHLEFYVLPDERRKSILGAQADRRAAVERARAATPLSPAEQGQRDADAERQKALEEARLAHSEAERLVAEEYGRLLDITRAQKAFADTLDNRRRELSDQREVTLGWQRRTREARENHGGASENADETYDSLRKELRGTRDQLDDALDDATDQGTKVPAPGPDRLSDLPIGIDVSKANAERKTVEEEAGRLIAEERQLREDYAAELLDDIDRLNQERLSLLDFLSPSKRDAITGFTAAALGQAEVRQLRLVLRYHRHATTNWLASLRQAGTYNRSALAPAAFIALKALFAIVPARSS
jgi:hypothetical protein